MNNNGLHRVQLQLAGLGCESHREVIAYYAVTYLVHKFGNNGVHLAGHKIGTGNNGREVNLVKTATGTARKQTQVVTNLRQLNR